MHTLVPPYVLHSHHVRHNITHYISFVCQLTTYGHQAGPCAPSISSLHGRSLTASTHCARICFCRPLILTSILSPRPSSHRMPLVVARPGWNGSGCDHRDCEGRSVSRVCFSSHTVCLHLLIVPPSEAAACLGCRESSDDEHHPMPCMRENE